MSLIYNDLSKVNLTLALVKADFLCYSGSTIRVLFFCVISDPFLQLSNSTFQSVIFLLLQIEH